MDLLLGSIQANGIEVVIRLIFQVVFYFLTILLGHLFDRPSIPNSFHFSLIHPLLLLVEEVVF
jgi:hypothetical protein